MSNSKLCEAFVLESTWVPEYIQRGWGNGYVIINSTHPLFGKDYTESCTSTIEAHGGITFSGIGSSLGDHLPGKFKGCEDLWVFGFDTAHYGDTKENWPKEAVIAETDRLREQLLKMYK